MSSEINTTEARELFAKTTQGDYISRHRGSEHYEEEEFATEIGDGVQVEGTAVCVAWCERGDAEFFSYAHNNWQAIFDTIERQEKEVERLRHFEQCVNNAMQWEPETCKAVVESARVELRIKRGDAID